MVQFHAGKCRLQILLNQQVLSVIRYSSSRRQHCFSSATLFFFFFTVKNARILDENNCKRKLFYMVNKKDTYQASPMSKDI